MNHSVRVNILNRYEAKTIDDLATKLVSEVLAPVGDTRVNLANCFLPVSTFFRTLGLCTHLALDFTKVFLITAVELGCRYGFVRGEESKVLESYVDTNLLQRGWQRFRFRQFTREGSPPLTAGVTLDGASLVMVQVLAVPSRGR